jgi:hypothetical protein
MTITLVGLFIFAGCSNGDSPSGASGNGNLRGKLATSAAARSAAAPSGTGARSAAAVGAEIILDGVPTGSFTDAEGEFALNVPAGTHTVSVSFNGMTSGLITVEMPVDGIVELEVELLPDGSLAVEQDIDHDGDVDREDDLDHDGDIGGDDDDDEVAGDHDGDDDEVAGDHDGDDDGIAGDHREDDDQDDQDDQEDEKDDEKVHSPKD